MTIRRIIGLVLLGFLALPSCDCSGEHDSNWVLDDEWPFEEEDAGQLDAEGAEDSEEESDAAWQPEEVEPSVPDSHALTDRTSIVVDPEGTLWLGYHHCNDLTCSQPMLRVMHKAVGSDWKSEDIGIHDGIFGLEIIKPGEPIIAYPDSFERVYRVSMRSSDGAWRDHDFPVERAGNLRYDGFDITANNQSYYISLAPDEASKVSLFRYTPDDAQPTWREMSPLVLPDPQAAMERGLRADEAGSVYLVNRSSTSGVYAVHRYDSEADRWTQSAEFESYADIFVHSLYITQDARLCISGSVEEVMGEPQLVLTCGSMGDLSENVQVFYDEFLSREHPSSIIEGHDGTLYVAFNPRGNHELRVASQKPGEQDWTIETVYDGPSYGVSTAIDLNGDLVISFYTCDQAGYCSLKVVWESPE